MHELVVGVVGIDAELGATCPQITLLEKVYTSIVVDKDPNSDVKLPLIDQEGLLYILLNDKAVMLEFVLLLLIRLMFLYLFIWLLLLIVC